MTGEREALTPASEQLINDWGKYPDAIDASELSARLWLIERQARAALPQAEAVPEPHEAERALNRLVPLLPSTARVHEDYNIIRAAMLAEAVSGSGLDVERLRLALVASGQAESYAFSKRWAERIAAAYDVTPEPTETDHDVAIKRGREM